MKQSSSSMKESKISYQSDSYQLDSKLINDTFSSPEKHRSKANSIDLKKINLNKNPSQSSSSLELLILILSKSLKFSLDQILGLFTNQNKYLAHVIVKGVNEDFRGIRQFYALLNQNIATLLRLYEQDRNDAFACLYAIKPGFISKDEQVSQLALNIFSSFQGIYDWFISKQSKCCGTFLLGVKRHKKIIEHYTNILFRLVKYHEVEFFSTSYVQCFASPIEFVEITSVLLRSFAKYFTGSPSSAQSQSLIDILQKNEVFQKWIEIAFQIYDENIDNKIIVIQFLGEFMLSLPKIMENYQSSINRLKMNWIHYPMPIFIPLFNEMLIMLQKLASVKSIMSKKIFTIIVDIFKETYEIVDKRDFIVNGFFSILSQFPNIPSDFFIKSYPIGRLNSSDFLLICEAIDISEEENSILKIGEVVKNMYFFDIITNFYLADLIAQIVKKIIKYESKETSEFIVNLLKTILSNYATFVSKIKTQPKNNSQQSYFGKKKSSEKIALQQKQDLILCSKRADLTIDLCDKIIDVVILQDTMQNYIDTVKNYILIMNSQVKKSNFGITNKRLSALIQKKLKVTKEEQNLFEDENKQNGSKSGFRLSDSSINKKARDSYGAISSLSRVQVPERVTKQFEEIIAKRKRQEETKAEQETRKKKEEQLKKIMYKKQIQKMNLIKGGFGEGQAQLKEEGFWKKFIKENVQIKVYTNDQVQEVYLQAADLIIKKYNKLFKYFFFNYSSTMYSVKANNFDQNQLRKQTLSAVQIIKFLKDYNLIHPTNLQQVQNLVKQINVKILHRKEVINELDYEGFQEFIRQFCLCIWNRNQIFVGIQEKHIKLDHLSLPQLISNLIEHLKNVFKSKGQNMTFFDVVESETQNSSPELRNFNQKLKENPHFILPQGFKKIIDKRIDFKPIIKESFNIVQSYKISLQVLNELIFSALTLHLIEPHSEKVVKFSVKPVHQINIRQKDPTRIKSRALSTILDRKMGTQSPLGNILTKNDLSKGIKKAMLWLKTQDKIIGEQVAFAFEEMLKKVQQQVQLTENQPKKLRTLQKSGEIQKKRSLSHRRVESLQKITENKIQKVANIGNDFMKIKNELFEKRQQKAEEQKKKQQEIQLKLKKKKDHEEKYYHELKQKIQERKRSQQEEESIKRQSEQKKQKIKASKQKFEEFHSKQVNKLKREFEEIIDKRKKDEEDKQLKIEGLEQKRRKIRSKIQNEDKEITQIRKETLQAITEITFSDQFKTLTKEYQLPLRTVFQYLQKLNSNPLSEKNCHPNEINHDTWLKFNKIFEISPLIVNSKDIINIFKAVTKEKRVSKDFVVGLSYEEFLQCLLRECIKHKTIFGKILQRVKDDKPKFQNDFGKNKKSKSITVKVEPKNEFEQQEELDVKKLLKEPDVRDDIIDHYGDVSNFKIDYFKGLIYYLKMPFNKKGQEKRIKELIENEKKPDIHVSNMQKLKQKLTAEYTLERAQKTKKQSKPQINKSKQSKDHSKQPKSQTKVKLEKYQEKTKKSQKK